MGVALVTNLWFVTWRIPALGTSSRPTFGENAAPVAVDMNDDFYGRAAQGAALWSFASAAVCEPSVRADGRRVRPVVVIFIRSADSGH
ncbi:MAG: hypothetical protein CMM93_05700 [Rickettsiales bacterium]|nr:hypothetical protein [Rickettsiales bacterium]